MDGPDEPGIRGFSGTRGESVFLVHYACTIPSKTDTRTHVNHTNHQLLIATFNAAEDAYGTRQHRHAAPLGTMSQEASEPRAVSQDTELLAEGNLAENPAKTSQAPVQSALESDADSSNDVSEDSTGPNFDSSSSSSRGKSENSDDFVEEVPAPAGNPEANDGGSGAAGAATASASAQAQGAVPARTKAKVAAGPANSSGKQVAGEASPASSKKKTLGC